jgi:putative hydrolase of the HAD superfamily
LEAHFHGITVSGEVGVGKPDARAFRSVLEKLGVPPGASVMVGDNLERDVAGAQALGMRAIWVDRTGGRRPDGVVPDARVATLPEVPAWVERWSSPASSSR